MMDDQNNSNSLLKEVGAIIKKADEIARLKGEKFNIFSILGMESNENKTHSNFLVSLLDPNGEHGQGNKFLNLFIENIFSTNNIANFYPSERKDNESDTKILDEILQTLIVTVSTEYNLGKKNLYETKGGRVDILIDGRKWVILIENKIYAGDQEKQIARYCNDPKYPRKIVFYLTLDGHEPSDNSTKLDDEMKNLKVDTHFYLLSYKTNIKNWLEECLKEAADYPIIRETIKQYLILIKKLTGQLTSNKMAEEIQKIIMKNMEAAKHIASNYEMVKTLARKEIADIIIKQLKINDGSLIIEFVLVKNWGESIRIRSDDLADGLMFYYEMSPNGTTRFGVVLLNKDEKKEYFHRISEIMNYKLFFDKKAGWISEPIETININDDLISEFAYLGDTRRDELVNEKITSEIVSLIESYKDQISQVDELLKSKIYN